ncbi:hypothetical protein PXW85_23935, partial [Klebsiella pneumoniae]|nr:hypothetical protein [Klebsiella pneumoniae]
MTIRCTHRVGLLLTGLLLVTLALCLLLASEAIRHLTVRPLWRWLLNAQVRLLPIILLANGAL